MNNVGKYCGYELPGEIRIASNEAFIRFVSGSYLTESNGFSLRFNSSQDGEPLECVQNYVPMFSLQHVVVK